MTETCRNCGEPILMMSARMTGFCSQVCQRTFTHDEPEPVAAAARKGTARRKAKKS